MLNWWIPWKLIKFIFRSFHWFHVRNEREFVLYQRCEKLPEYLMCLSQGLFRNFVENSLSLQHWCSCNLYTWNLWLYSLSLDYYINVHSAMQVVGITCPFPLFLERIMANDLDIRYLSFMYHCINHLIVFLISLPVPHLYDLISVLLETHIERSCSICRSRNIINIQ